MEWRGIAYCGRRVLRNNNIAVIPQEIGMLVNLRILYAWLDYHPSHTHTLCIERYATTTAPLDAELEGAVSLHKQKSGRQPVEGWAILSVQWNDRVPNTC